MVIFVNRILRSDGEVSPSVSQYSRPAFLDGIRRSNSSSSSYNDFVHEDSREPPRSPTFLDGTSVRAISQACRSSNGEHMDLFLRTQTDYEFSATGGCTTPTVADPDTSSASRACLAESPKYATHISKARRSRVLCLHTYDASDSFSRASKFVGVLNDSTNSFTSARSGFPPPSDLDDGSFVANTGATSVRALPSITDA
jgi:hypothetical protein